MKGSYLLVDVFSALLMAGSFALLLPKGFAYPADESIVGDSESLSYPISEVGKLQDMELPHHNYIQKPKSCFHFYVSRNMSSLLSDATKMLQQVRDRHEREWILTFIYRIKSLAEHLRTHPESRNYDCLTGEDEGRRRNSILSDHLRIPQPELYFVDDMLLNTNQKRAQKGSDSSQEVQPDEEEYSQQKTSDNQDPQLSSTGRKQSLYNAHPESDSPSFDVMVDGSSTKVDEENLEAASEPSSEHSNPEKENVSPPPNRSSGDGIVLSSPPDCEANRECERALNRQIAEGILSREGSTVSQDNDQLVQQVPMKQHEQNIEEDRRQQRVLKQRIRKALLEEMAPEVKKLRTVGGSEDDLINLWKLSETETGKSSESPHYSDFDYEEIGAAAGDLTSSDRFTTSDHTVAPSLGDMKNFKRQLSSEGGTKAYEPYDDSDVLVKQLFDVRFEQAHPKTTKSVNEGNGEYLITSTHVPY